MKRLFCFGLIYVISSFFVEMTWASSQSLKALTRQLSKDVLKVLQQENRDRRQQEALKLINQYFDFDTFAQWTLVDHWTLLSVEQRHRFLEVFHARWTENILNHLSKPTKKNFTLKVLSENHRKDYTEVKCQLQYNGKKVSLSLAWIQKQKHWYIADVTISKANLVANYQGQFNKIIRGHGFDELMRRIEEKQIQ